MPTFSKDIHARGAGNLAVCGTPYITGVTVAAPGQDPTCRFCLVHLPDAEGVALCGTRNSSAVPYAEDTREATCPACILKGTSMDQYIAFPKQGDTILVEGKPRIVENIVTERVGSGGEVASVTVTYLPTHGLRVGDTVVILEDPRFNAGHGYRPNEHLKAWEVRTVLNANDKFGNVRLGPDGYSISPESVRKVETK